MDPITLAIVGAAAGGAITGVVTPPVTDAYNALKSLLKRKFGHTPIPMAVEQLEADPQSEAWKAVLQEQIAKAGVDKDTEILEAAKKVQALIEDQPGGDRLLKQVAVGSNIAQAADHSTASVNVNQPKP